MNVSFEHNVALVTGAGSGMGLVTAKAFAEAGVAVVLADIHENAVRSAAEELVSAGHQAIAVRCNVADETEGNDRADCFNLWPPGFSVQQRRCTASSS